ARLDFEKGKHVRLAQTAREIVDRGLLLEHGLAQPCVGVNRIALEGGADRGRHVLRREPAMRRLVSRASRLPAPLLPREAEHFIRPRKRPLVVAAEEEPHGHYSAAWA